MDWLNDPKNRPVVAAGLAVFIVVMGVVIYFLYFKPSSEVPVPAEAPQSAPAEPGTAPQTTAAGAPTEPVPGAQPGPAATGTAPGAPAGPSTTGSAQPAAQVEVASAEPMEAWRPDPFLPLGYKPPKAPEKNLKPHIRDFPFPRIPVAIRKVEQTEKPELPQPVRRMAGVLVNNRVFAIIETKGEAEIVQPGDTLKDRLAVVEKIERDKVLLRTKDEKPRYIVVRMAAAASQPTAPTERPSTRPSVREPFAPSGRTFPGVRRTPQGDLDMD